MATPNSQLTYPAFGSVLKHLKSELRLEIFQKIPSCRSADRQHSLYFDTLKLGAYSIKTNETEYRVGLVREYHNNVTPPPHILRSNAEGGVRFDYGEQFGDPNDPESAEWRHRDRKPSEKAADRKFKSEARLRDLMQRLPYQTEPAKQGGMESEIRYLRVQIRNYNEQLAISQLKYTHYIQLTIITDDVTRMETERVYYASRLLDAMQYVVDKLFSGRKEDHVIQVSRDLIIEQPCTWPHDGLKIRFMDPEILVQLNDGTMTSIEFPAYNAIFQNVICQKFQVSLETILIKFKIEKASLGQAFTSIEHLTEGLIDEGEERRLRRREFPIIFVIELDRSTKLGINFHPDNENENQYSLAIGTPTRELLGLNFLDL